MSGVLCFVLFIFHGDVDIPAHRVGSDRLKFVPQLTFLLSLRGRPGSQRIVSSHVSDVHCGGQTPEHHEQCSSEEGNRRTVDKRHSGKIHQLVRVQRDHVEKRHRAGNNRVQKSCS